MKNKILLIGGIAILIAIFYRLQEAPQQQQASTSPWSEKITPKEESLPPFMGVFQTRLDFWGIVLDESGSPISGAKVKIISDDDPDFEDGQDTENFLLSDEAGRFQLLGTNGSRVTVWVEKEGFTEVFNEDISIRRGSLSRGSFSKQGLGDLKLPTRTSPAVFVLRRKLVADKLNVFGDRRFEFPINDAPVYIDLTTGGTVLQPTGTTVKIKCLAHPDKRISEGRNAPFDWKFEISAPAGGVLQKATSSDKAPIPPVAPEQGYKASIEILRPAEAEDWTWAHSGLEVWVRLGDGTFARTEWDIRVGRKNSLYLESYHNPTGSRNLEYDSQNATRL